MPRTYRQEFPDFHASDLPTIPADWQDVSWRDDEMPSWAKGKLEIYINYRNPEDQRSRTTKRFFIMDYDSRETLLRTDKWDEVLAFVTDSPRATERIR